MLTSNHLTSRLQLLNAEIAANLSKRRNFLLLNILGYVALFFIHQQVNWFSSTGNLSSELLLNRETEFWVPILEILTLIYLFSLYFLSLINWQRLNFKIGEIFRLGFLLTLIAWCILPANSSDVFAYVGFGRIAGIYHLNPYLHGYSEIYDFYSRYAWFKQSMPYGPLVLPIFILAGFLSQLNVLVSLYFLKLVSLVAYGCSVWLLYSILKPLKLNTGYSLFLFAFNPFILLELIINAHNDSLLILFSLLAIFALQRQWHTVAVGMALLSTLVKIPGAVLLIAILAYLIQQRQWKALIYSLIGSLILLGVLKITLLPNIEAISSLVNPNSEENSIFGVLLRQTKKFGLYAELKDNGFLRIHSILFAIFCLWRLRMIRDFHSLVKETIYLTLGLVTLYSVQFRPWYITWLIPYAAIAKSEQLRQIIVLFSFTVLTFYAVPNRYLSFQVNAIQYILAYGVPLLVSGWVASRPRVNAV